MSDQGATVLIWILLFILGCQILRFIQMMIDYWFYTPPDYGDIKTYYTAMSEWKDPNGW